MADSTKRVNITDLPEVDSVAGSDKLIVQRDNTTFTVKFNDFVVGSENVSFYSEVATVRDTNSTLLSNSLSTVTTLEQLSAYYPGTNGTNELMYVKEREAGDGIDTGGFFIYDSTNNYADNKGTIINPAGNAGAGRWRRVNYDKVNIKWFGAKSGSSFDSTTAIQNAIDFAADVSADKHTALLVPAGTFYVTGLSSPAYLHMEGQSLKSQILLASTATSDLLTLESCDEVVIKDIKFTGVTSVSSNVISLKNSQDINILNCEIGYGGSNGVYLEGCLNCNILGNKFLNNATNGIQVLDSSTNSAAYNNISNNRFRGSTILDINETYNVNGQAVGANMYSGNISDTWEAGRYGIPSINANEFGTSNVSPSGTSGALRIGSVNQDKVAILNFENGLVVNYAISASGGVVDMINSLDTLYPGVGDGHSH